MQCNFIESEEVTSSQLVIKISLFNINKSIFQQYLFITNPQNKVLCYIKECRVSMGHESCQVS